MSHSAILCMQMAHSMLQVGHPLDKCMETALFFFNKHLKKYATNAKLASWRVPSIYLFFWEEEMDLALERYQNL